MTTDNNPTNLAELRALVAAAEARPSVTNDAELKAHHVALAEAAVAGAKAGLAKLEAHVAGARDAVIAAHAELEAVKATDYVFEEPQEHVVVRAGGAGA